MPQFEALERTLEDADYLTLPVYVPSKKTTIEYSIPPMSGRDGLFAQRMMNLLVAASIEDSRPRDADKPAPPSRPKLPVLDDEEERDLYERVLGEPLLERMLDDGVEWPMIQRCSVTALLYATTDATVAEAYWKDPNRGKELAAQRSRATARSPKKAGPSGTKASRKRAKKAARPRGSGSSSAGR